MWWAMLAQGAMSAIKTANENKFRRKQVEAANKAAAAADYATVANASQAISALNVQNGQLRVEAAAQLNAAEVEAYKAAGSAVANAAAAGVKGASVDAVVMDIDRELGDVKTDVEQNLEIQQYNLTNRIREVVAGASNSLRGQMNPYSGEQSPLLNGLMTVGSSYLNNYMQFGGGFGGGGDSGAQSFAAGPDTAQGLTFGTGT